VAKAKKKGKGGQAAAAGDGQVTADTMQAPAPGKMKRLAYEQELADVSVELIKLQEYVKAHGLRIVVVFEGRDAAGKGGAIKTIASGMNPRVCRIAALPAPNDRERTQWYFQRYVAELPAAGEIVLFDRSWYNRAGVERVMGFCTDEEYEEFMRACPQFEEMLLRSGIQLVKYWFSVSDDEQERRFQARLADPTKHWKLSPMDLESRRRWVDYSRAKDAMFGRTDTPLSPWWVIEADDKRPAEPDQAPVVDHPVRVRAPRGAHPATAPERRRLRATAPRDSALRAQRLLTDTTSRPRESSAGSLAGRIVTAAWRRPSSGLARSSSRPATGRPCAVSPPSRHCRPRSAACGTASIPRRCWLTSCGSEA
jgi:polyphosphate kinase 2